MVTGIVSVIYIMVVKLKKVMCQISEDIALHVSLKTHLVLMN